MSTPLVKVKTPCTTCSSLWQPHGIAIEFSYAYGGGEDVYLASGDESKTERFFPHDLCPTHGTASQKLADGVYHGFFAPVKSVRCHFAESAGRFIAEARAYYRFSSSRGTAILGQGVADSEDFAKILAQSEVIERMANIFVPPESGYLWGHMVKKLSDIDNLSATACMRLELQDLIPAGVGAHLNPRIPISGIAAHPERAAAFIGALFECHEKIGRLIALTEGVEFKLPTNDSSAEVEDFFRRENARIDFYGIYRHGVYTIFAALESASSIPHHLFTSSSHTDLKRAQARAMNEILDQYLFCKHNLINVQRADEGLYPWVRAVFCYQRDLVNEILRVRSHVGHKHEPYSQPVAIEDVITAARAVVVDRTNAAAHAYGLKVMQVRMLADESSLVDKVHFRDLLFS